MCKLCEIKMPTTKDELNEALRIAVEMGDNQARKDMYEDLMKATVESIINDNELIAMVHSLIVQMDGDYIGIIPEDAQKLTAINMLDPLDRHRLLTGLLAKREDNFEKLRIIKQEIEENL
jgi:hypothetical protein